MVAASIFTFLVDRWYYTILPAGVLILFLLIIFLYRLFFKRLIDIIISGVALIFLSPLLLTLCVLVRIKLGKPIIFAQMRPGKKNKVFKLHKFRTMTNERGTNGELLPDSARLTKFGKFLRSTSLDELPELWDIFRGKMSLIGPRPLLVQYLPLYNEEQIKRHNVRPGLTGLAQVNGRNAISWEQKFELDVKYVNKCSFFLDIKIFFKTILKVFKRSGISQEGQSTMEAFKGSNQDLKKELIIIGAGGHGKVVAEIAELCGYNIVGFLDDNLSKDTKILKWPIIGNIAEADKFINKIFILAIGDNYTRERLSEQKISYATLIHPTAVISKSATIGNGCVVMANVVINADSKIGNHCIINTAAIIEHDNNIEDFVHISPKVSLAGKVTVGKNTHIGIGATVKNNITISNDIIIGAGAVVVKNITKTGTYIGVPCKELLKNI